MWLNRALEFVNSPPEYRDPRYADIHRQQILDKINGRFDQMSDKKSRKTGTGVDKNGHATWRGFSNVPLTESMKKEFEKWLKPDMNAPALADRMAMEGYKINLAYNQKNRAFSCAVTCQDPDSPNAGLTMTSLAPSSEYALFLAYWKHVVVCEETWPQPNEGAGNSQWG